MAARGPSPRPFRGGPTLHHTLSIPPSPPGPPQNAENHRQDKLLQPREDLPRIPSPPRGTDSPIGAPLPFLGEIWSFRRIEPQGFGHLPWPGAPPPGGPGTREPGEDTPEPGYLPHAVGPGSVFVGAFPSGFSWEKRQSGQGVPASASRRAAATSLAAQNTRSWWFRLSPGDISLQFLYQPCVRLRPFVSAMLFSWRRSGPSNESAMASAWPRGSLRRAISILCPRAAAPP